MMMIPTCPSIMIMQRSSPDLVENGIAGKTIFQKIFCMRFDMITFLQYFSYGIYGRNTSRLVDDDGINIT
jgi:hypothetical protein